MIELMIEEIETLFLRNLEPGAIVILIRRDENSIKVKKNSFDHGQPFFMICDSTHLKEYTKSNQWHQARSHCEEWLRRRHDETICPWTDRFATSARDDTQLVIPECFYRESRTKLHICSWRMQSTFWIPAYNMRG
jgi:hypothetical protein